MAYLTQFLIYLLMIVSTVLMAQDQLRAKEYNVAKGIAIQGYDPVAYFISGKAIKGSKEFSFTYQGITYLFSSSSNKQRFISNPEQYEPQYGGWCAYAMGASGEKVEIDPETFKVKDGKLYLFYHSWINNTLIKWNNDEHKLKPDADANWQKIINHKTP